MHRLILIFIAAILTGCTFVSQIDGAEEGSPMGPGAEEWADSVLALLTPRQRAAQLLIPSVYATADAATMRLVNRYAREMQVGGLLLLSGKSDDAAAIADTVRKNSDVPMWIAIDAEWGLGMRLKDAPSFPPNGKISPLIRDFILNKYGMEVGSECRMLGINMLFGPVADIVGDPDNSYIGYRSFGGDPERVAEMVEAYTRGVLGCGIMAVPKHFPGHGSVEGDSHKALPVINRSLHQLDSIDLYPFRHLIRNGVYAIMVGHLALPAIDPQMLPAAVSPIVIKELLREDLNFNGLIITDALSMDGIKGYDAVDALLAGADIVIAPVNTQKEIDVIMQGIESGRISQEVIDEHVWRVLFYKYYFGLATDSWQRPTAKEITRYFNREEVKDLALKLRM